MADLKIAKSITLPCGLTFPNRLAKAAMAEGWGDKNRLPTDRLVETYGAWADGGWGMVLTGNVQIDAAYLGTHDDNAVNEELSHDEHLASWKKWAAITNRNNTPTIMQLNHPGRQSLPGAGTHGFFGKTMAPSPVPVQLGKNIITKIISAFVFGTPREMTEQDIQGVIQRFANGAKLAHEAGFAGVQIHGAHGYLLAQFLSARTNKRTDKYGGSPKNRARIVVEVIDAIREVVPKTFCVGIKLNSVDHQSEKELGECIEQLEDICKEGLDFLEISGGTYEDPTMMTGKNEDGSDKSDRTVAREAFFLEFAHAIREKFSDIPLMVTGGFRSRQAMESAIQTGGCDIIGIARPAVLNPMLPNNTILNKKVSDNDAKVYARTIQNSWITRVLGMRAVTGAADTMWYVKEIHRILNRSKL